MIMDVSKVLKQAKKLLRSRDQVERALGRLYQHWLDMLDEIQDFGGEEYCDELLDALEVLRKAVST